MTLEKMIYNGRYQLHTPLGQGGMGIVYRASDRLTSDLIALKQIILPNDASSDATQVNTSDLHLALAHEFQTLASLRHPHIISVLDYGFYAADAGAEQVASSQPFFTMSYLPEAQTIIQAGVGLSTERRVNLLRQMLEALAYLHRRGILHRDLKPENVLVTDDTLRLLDFGLAIAKGKEGASAGTWAYVAPELLEEYPASEASDLYAVGVMAYQLFAHALPFDPGDLLFIEKLLDEPPDLAPLAEVPALMPIIERLLAKDPADRYPHAESCIEAFSRALAQPVPRESHAIRESYLQAATFVGREAEKAQLLDALATAQAGKGSAWLVGGESGVGKSRLFEEIRIQALVQGALVLRGQGVESTGGLSYQIWRDPVRRLVLTTECDDLTVSVLQTLVPDIGSLLGREVLPAPALEAQAAKQRLVSTVTNLFRSQSQWMLLILEDLQWVKESLEVLQQLTRLAAQMPLVILGSYRDDERPSLPEEIPNAELVTLPRLSPEEMADLSQGILGEAGKQPEVIALLQRETEGNAFFLVEVVRALAEEAGRLSGVGQMALPDQLFPQGIRTIVERRLARVPTAARALLPAVAVVGRELDLKIVGHLVAQAQKRLSLDNWLTICADTAVLEVYDGNWRFAHDKLRTGILATLTQTQQVERHREVAQAIEQLYPDDPEQAGRLVYHWRAVGDVSKERLYARMAGEQAQRQYLNNEAIAYFSRALDLTPESDLKERFELLLAREQIYHLQGEREKQIENLFTLNQIAVRLVEQENIDRRAEVALRLANYATAVGDYASAIESAQEAIQLAQVNQDTRSIAAGFLAWGQSLSNQGAYEEAQEKLQQALSLAQTAKHPEIEADTLRILGMTYMNLGHFSEASGYCQRALSLYRQSSNKLGETITLNNLAIVAQAQGDSGQALPYFEQVQHNYREIGDREGNSRALINLGAIFMDIGEYAQAQRFNEEALIICREIDARLGECFALLNLGLSLHYQGEHLRAEHRGWEAYRISEGIGGRRFQAHALMTLGLALSGQDRLEEAADVFRQALKLWRELGLVNFAMEAHACLAHTSLLQGNLSTAQSEVEIILDHLQQGHTLDGTESPYRNYLICYQVLAANQDGRSDELLREAHNVLQKHASFFTNETIRQAFLEKVAANREIVSAFARIDE